VITIVEFLGIQQLELINVIVNINYESLTIAIPYVTVNAVIGLIIQFVNILEIGPDLRKVVDVDAECILTQS
jgi:hypothetical protein